MAVAETHQQALVWSAHPARSRPWATLAALVVVAGAAWGAAEWMGHPGWAALAIAFFLISLHRFFLPSQFRIDGEGVTVRSAFVARTLSWQQIRNFQHDSQGGVVSSRPSRFAATIYLMFRGNREEVVGRIQDRLDERATS